MRRVTSGRAGGIRTGNGRGCRRRVAGLVAGGGATAALLASGAPAYAVPVASARTSPTSNLTLSQRSCVSDLVASMTVNQRVGQLIWVGLDASAAPSGVDSTVRSYALGGVVLLGGFHSGRTSVATTTHHLSGLADPRVGLFVSADQEGGYVQQLQGYGFTDLPTAFTQGTKWAPSTLVTQTTTVAKQMRVAGVNVNLAPVADTVSKSFMPYNRPIGYYFRNYDYSADRVATDVNTVVASMHAGGVAATVKHFPGLGRVTGNTDTSATGITDDVTEATSGYLIPFKSGIAAGADFVMMSSAWYPKIDSTRQAVFSQATISGLLRGSIGYQGVVVTDDMGNAVAVQSTPVGSRATRFITAGGDIILTGNPATVGPMISAILAARQKSPSFAAKVDDSVARVLALKTGRGLTTCS